MRAAGQWAPMSAATPVRRWWPHWLRVFWFVLGAVGRQTDARGIRGRVARAAMRTNDIGWLKMLGMIGFARWSIFDRVPTQARRPSSVGLLLDRVLGQDEFSPSSPEGTRSRSVKLDNPYVLFDTNYNGRTEEYLESFCLIVPTSMRLTWSSWFTYGVPDPARVGKFIRYVEHATSLPAYYYSAYPDATAKQILAALELRLRLEEFRRGPGGDPGGAAFRAEWNRLLEHVQAIRKPWGPKGNTPFGKLSTLARIEPGRRFEVEKRIRTHLPKGKRHVPETTHFARWVVLPYLLGREEGQRLEDSFLLFSAWYDAPRARSPNPDPLRYLRALHAELGEHRVHQIWGLCGLPDGDLDRFCSFMRSRTRLIPPQRDSIDFAGYKDTSVAQIRTALELAKEFGRVMAASHRLDDSTLRKEWRKFESDRLHPAAGVFA